MKTSYSWGYALLLAAAGSLVAPQFSQAQTKMKHGHDAQGMAKDGMAKEGMAMAGEVKVGNLTLSGGWTRATPKSAPTGAGFVTITNHGTTADRLLSVVTPIAKRAEIHTMSMTEGVMKMRKLHEGLEIPAGKTVMLKPGGFHMMFIGLKGPVEKGATVSATLTFETAGDVMLELPAAKIGARMPKGKMGGHSHGG